MVEFTLCGFLNKLTIGEKNSSIAKQFIVVKIDPKNLKKHVNIVG